MNRLSRILFCCAIAICLLAFYAFAKDDQPTVKGFDYFIKTLPNNSKVAVFRIDPKSYRFTCAYANPPKTVEAFAKEKKARLIVNGGYWDANYKPTDLLIVDGKTIKPVNKVNYHFGLFYVKRGLAGIRDIRYSPIRKNEKFQQAIKCGPTLVKTGSRMYKHKTQSRHARNAIAKDKKGNLIFVLSERGRLSYEEMSTFLLSKEIGATYAFNLDGGSSVSYSYQQNNGKWIHRRGAPVSSVICVFSKK